MSGARPDLSAFEGRWHLSRVIDDALTGSTAHFDGSAIFVPGDEGLDYSETGLLTMSGQPPFKAERRYKWVTQGSDIHVFFDDGRFFHSIGLTQWDADHWCDPDSYRVAYDFAAWPNWQARWAVTGPRKNYAMVSNYSPFG